MKCVVCHHGDTKPGMTTVTFHRDGRTLVVNEVPADVCENCGEAYVAEDVTGQLLEISVEAGKAHATVLVRDFASVGANVESVANNARMWQSVANPSERNRWT
jgi:YgiT-type zinc finger domain-containing protein